MVEFAVVAPVIFALIFGFFEFGRMTMVQHAIANAAREGARMASLASTQSGSIANVDAFVRNTLSGAIPNANDPAIVNVTVNMPNTSSGSDVSVRVVVNYANITWMPGNFLGLNANGQLVAEQHTERE